MTLEFGLMSTGDEVIVRAAEFHTAPPVPGTTAPSASGTLLASTGVTPTGTWSTMTVSWAMLT